MRLICPGCGAQYEIDDALVPATGRDVQCSACGHAWFQYPAEIDAASAADDSTPAAGEDEGTDTPAAAAPPATPPAAESARRPIDPAVVDVLRAEAAHEERLRAQEAARPTVPQEPPAADAPPDPAPETPADPAEPASGLEPQAPSSGGRRARKAEAAAPPEPARARADTEGTRGGLLPDIESISSTLKPEKARRSNAAGSEHATPDADSRGGFVQGFTAVVIAMLALVLLYMFAEPLAQAVPPLADALAGYVRLVEGALQWAAGLVDSVTVWLRGSD